MATHSNPSRGDGAGRGERPTERHWSEREQSTQYFQNANAFRFNRGREGDQEWRPRDYSDDDYRFDRSAHIDYGERYGFGAYGKAHYDPDANRDFVDPRREPHAADSELHQDRSTGGNRGSRSGSDTRDHRGKAPKNYTRSDERIREDVAERLTADADVDPSDVEVLVSNGEVRLRGTIADRPMKRRAEDIAEMVMGVKDVHNELRLSGLAMTSGSADSETGTSSDGRQQSTSQTEGTRGGGKQTKTPHNSG